VEGKSKGVEFNFWVHIWENENGDHLIKQNPKTWNVEDGVLCLWRNVEVLHLKSINVGASLFDT
jgi:hypothetical protein